MSQFLKVYGDAEGPLGFPMKDADAKAIEALMQQHPGAEYVRAVVEKATTELSDGERADVSWIQTEAIDRAGEIVLQSGFRDDQYKSNPIVTINHDYTKSPVGRSIWRKKVKDGDRRGVKAKTVYPARPEEWADDIWPSDTAWALVKSGLMGGKSIGFLTLKSHPPTDDEIRRRPELQKVRRIIDEWMLLEYCCCWLPTNPEAAVEAVSKSLVQPEALIAFGIDVPPPPEVVSFTPLEQYEKAMQRTLEAIDTKAFVEALVRDSLDRLQGRV